MSAGMEAGPKTFAWHFASPIELTDVVLHQHPLFPTKSGLIEVEGPGKRVFCHEFKMPDAEPTSRIPTVISLPEGLLTKTLRVTLREGYREGIVGLEAVEAFSDTWSPTPDGALLTVSEDIGGLSAGDTVYYRLCCRTERDESTGEVRSLKLPLDRNPRLYSLTAFKTRPEKSIYLVRGNALGNESRLIWWTDKSKPEEIPFGHEITRQHRAIILRGPARKAGMLYARLMSDASESDTLEAAIV
jgi:hypothetical protein